MRTFGACLAIIGAILGLMIWPFGWLMLIVGLLLMIAAPNKVNVEQVKPASRQSTGGYAGLEKKAPHSEFDLGEGSGRKQAKSEDPWGNRKFKEE